MESITQWQQQRLERLKSKTGWLNLAGLFWLEEGENSFGSDPSNKVVFPEKAAHFCGTLTLTDGKVHLEVAEGVQIAIGDSLITRATLKSDHEENTTHLQQGDLAWYIIKRGELDGCVAVGDCQCCTLSELLGRARQRTAIDIRIARN